MLNLYQMIHIGIEIVILLVICIMLYNFYNSIYVLNKKTKHLLSTSTRKTDVCTGIEKKCNKKYPKIFKRRYNNCIKEQNIDVKYPDSESPMLPVYEKSSSSKPIQSMADEIHDELAELDQSDSSSDSESE